MYIYFTRESETDLWMSFVAVEFSWISFDLFFIHQWQNDFPPSVKAKLMTSAAVSCVCLLPPSVHSPLLSSFLLFPSTPSCFRSPFQSDGRPTSHTSNSLADQPLGKRECLVMRKREKRMITLCLFEFLSSCCLSYSCYIHGVHMRLVTV